MGQAKKQFSAGKKRSRDEEFALLEVLADLLLAVEAHGNLDSAIEAGAFANYAPAWMETFRHMTPSRLGGLCHDPHSVANWDAIFQTMMNNDILRESFLRMRMAKLYPVSFLHPPTASAALAAGDGTALAPDESLRN